LRGKETELKVCDGVDAVHGEVGEDDDPGSTNHRARRYHGRILPSSTSMVDSVAVRPAATGWTDTSTEQPGAGHRDRVEIVSGVSELVAALAERGLDLVAPFPHGDPPSLAFLVGNSRALWPRFLDWLAADPARAAAEHPLESYVEETLSRATARLPCSVEYAHAGPPWPPIQRLAERAGLAWVAPSHLAIHPVLGPWLSLRAIVVTELPPPPAPAQPPACPACAGACLPAFERARATLDASSPTASMRAAWRLWLAVRDACPLGREHRFQEDHLAYGYTNDNTILSQRR
jgi:methylmalonic aciduria homocystinuria type C protein